MPTAQILLIDDEPNIRATLAAVLGDAGYSVTTCASAEEALGLPEVEDVRQGVIAYLPG